MTSVLITGGTGFVGNCLVRYLLRQGYEVHLLTRAPGSRWRIADLADQVTTWEGAVESSTDVRRVMQSSQPQWVFHLAVHGAYSHQRDVGQMIQTNVRGTYHLLEAAAECSVESFVHAGSSSEYGFKSSAPSEGDVLEPNSHYAVTKAAATHLCRLAAVEGDRNVVSLRLYSVYGPFEEPGRLIPTLLDRALGGSLPPLVDPTTARDFVYVDDVCEAFVRVAMLTELPRGAIFNVGSGRQTTLAQLVTLIRSMFDVNTEPRWGSMAARSWDTGSWVADIGEIVQRTGWHPTTDLQSGLSLVARWLVDHPELRAAYAQT